MQKVGEMVPLAQAEVRQDLQAMFRGAIRASLELFLEAELETLVGAEWYARVVGRRDRRNGSYPRRVLTSLGRSRWRCRGPARVGRPARSWGATNGGRRRSTSC